MNFEHSIQLYNRAKRRIPGGVNSPVRAFKAVGGDPVFMASAEGSRLYDVDGNEYIDYIGSWGPMILGHAHPKVIRAVDEASRNSLSFGTPNKLEVEIAELISEMVPNIEKIRFVNSGTEACMSALRVARGYTGNNKFIKFEGCYHGHADPFLVKGGSGMSTLGIPNSPGVTPGTIQDTLIATYNDLDSVRKIVNENKAELAAIMVEPVAGNMGCIPPTPEFITGLRDICTEHGILLIFDEVMTGFRLGKGGAQEYLGIEADIVTYGKIIGGGMPVGAFGGSNELMSVVAPEGPVYQAGTLSGNPVAMASGLATLTELNLLNGIYEELDQKGKYLESGLAQVMENSGVDFTINRIGSMISLHFTDKDVVDFETAKGGDNENFRIYYHQLLNQGIYLPPSAYESWFLSVSLEKEMLDKTVKATEHALEQLMKGESKN